MRRSTARARDPGAGDSRTVGAGSFDIEGQRLEHGFSTLEPVPSTPTLNWDIGGMRAYRQLSHGQRGDGISGIDPTGHRLFLGHLEESASCSGKSRRVKFDNDTRIRQQIEGLFERLHISQGTHLGAWSALAVEHCCAALASHTAD